MSDATLPELERMLVAAAATHRRRWRWSFAVGAVIAVSAVGAATAGIFYGEGSTVDTGATEAGFYVIKVKPDSKHPHPGGPVCLQTRIGDGRPAYGCGVAPSAAEPFGLVVVTYAVQPENGLEPTQQLFYGLVADDISRVSVLGEGAEHFDAQTSVKPGLPGRYFSVVAPTQDRIELVGFDDSGAEVARIGSREKTNRQPLSHDDAVAMGDPAGFAPTAVPIRTYTYQGRPISTEEISELGLVCEDGSGECYDSVAEAEAAN